MNSNNNAPNSTNTAELNTQYADIPLSSNLDQNMLFLKESLGKSTDLIIRELSIGAHFKKRAAIVYIDVLVDTTMVQDFIIRPLTTEYFKNGKQDALTGDLRQTRQVRRAEVYNHQKIKLSFEDHVIHLRKICERIQQ